MPRLVAGRLNTTQCVKVPPGASGSSMIRATLAAPAGMPVQVNGIGVLPPRQENLTGIAAPAANAGLRTVMAPGPGAVTADVACSAGVLPACPDPVDPPQAASRSAVSAPTPVPSGRERMRRSFRSAQPSRVQGHSTDRAVRRGLAG